MYKDNGRKEAASKEELASLKEGKSMYCPTCSEFQTVEHSEFGSDSCTKCNCQLLDLSIASIGKATGK